MYETLEPNERREWVWPDSTLPENIVIKKQDATIENMFDENIEQSSIILMNEDDRFRKWKWS